MAGVNRPLTRRSGPRFSYLEVISFVQSEVPTTYTVPTTYPVEVNQWNTLYGTFPALEGLVSMSTGVPSGFTATFPALQGAVRFGWTARATFPALQGALSATVNPVLRINATFPALQGEFSSITGGVTSVDATFPALQGSASFGWRLAATFPALQGELSGITGGVLRANATFPALTGSLSVESVDTLRINVTFPALATVPSLWVNVTLPALTAHVVMREVVTVTYEAYAINLTTGAVSHYTNYPFDNILRFGSSYYGISAAGIYLIGGDLDLTVPIDAHIKTFATKLGSQNQKRVPYVYSSGRSDGGVVVGVTADEGETYEYESDWGEIAGSTNHRTTVGKGIKGVYYSFDVKNVNGGSLELDEISVHVAPTQRAI